MERMARTDLFHGLFTWHPVAEGGGRLSYHPEAPRAIPDPVTGQRLQIATVDVGSAAICPECDRRAQGGHISFVADLRVVYACPQCCQLVWINGA
jgi:hypothetical protein